MKYTTNHPNITVVVDCEPLQRARAHTAAMQQWERETAAWVVSDEYGMRILSIIRDLHQKDIDFNCTACHEESWPCQTIVSVMTAVHHPLPKL